MHTISAKIHAIRVYEGREWAATEQAKDSTWTANPKIREIPQAELLLRKTATILYNFSATIRAERVNRGREWAETEQTRIGLGRQTLNFEKFLELCSFFLKIIYSFGKHSCKDV